MAYDQQLADAYRVIDDIAEALGCAADNEVILAQIDRFKFCTKELADDLEAEIRATYGCHDGDPRQEWKRKFERDMAPVQRARALLADGQTSQDK